ncbi:hypothetical protein EVA_10563 [gut metagenome]|uniref:Uncharacterized protein n=1 Tax=gut metagenome TaxID=749906 RepID=J9G3A6_9ZZZZ
MTLVYSSGPRWNKRSYIEFLPAVPSAASIYSYSDRCSTSLQGGQQNDDASPGNPRRRAVFPQDVTSGNDNHMDRMLMLYGCKA